MRKIEKTAGPSTTDFVQMEETSEHIERLGTLLRQRRKALRMTMKTVAIKAGLTEGFISQIERGISTPSLVTLYKIANVLGTSVDTFLDHTPPAEHSIVSRAESRQGYNIETKERVYEIVERGFPGALLNGCITHIPPGYVSEMTSHEGEDFLYLIEGEILYEINGKEYYLKAGDTLHFPSSLPHRARNMTSKTAKELWVGTTPILDHPEKKATAIGFAQSVDGVV